MAALIKEERKTIREKRKIENLRTRAKHVIVVCNSNNIVLVATIVYCAHVLRLSRI